MRKLLYAVAFLTLLAGCSGHEASAPSPAAGGAATHGGARAPRSIGGTGTTSLTYNDTYAVYTNCNPSGLTITNGSYAVSSLSFPAGQGQQLMVSNCNGFTTPQNVKVTLGTPSYGFPYIREDGYNITVDAFGPAQVTATWTALSSGQTGTVTYTIGSPVDFTTLWQTGSGSATGSFVTDMSACNGNAGAATQTITSDNISFAIHRDTLGSDQNVAGSSACYRNQLDPHGTGSASDPATPSGNLLFAYGLHYTFYFQTVVTLNGNTYYGVNPDQNLAVSIPAIVWQTHSYGTPGAGPCDMLVIGNTRKAYVSGYNGYGTVTGGGQPTWTFRTCTDPSDYTGHAYNSPDTLYDGEVDNWQIDIDAQKDDAQMDGNGGHVTARRNGTVVYDAAAATCDSTTANGCWWNFGPYMFYWATTEEPQSYNSAGVTVNMNGMTWTTPVSGGGGLSRARKT
jgi:hypothetical protein